MRTPALFLSLVAAAWGATPEPLRISVEEYRDKVYASWLGQCVGNIYGLAHEQKYFFEPGPDNFPLGYSGWGASRMKKLNGAFSDDDTDVEYMYLLAMEKHGVEPTYADLAAFWRRHVRQHVWLGNRAAVAAMHHGLTAPWTGTQSVNPHWFQIDPQLVNEIWAVTAPGMPRYAAAKSAWGARIMSDGWATEPTIAYGAMYAAAFFESDIHKLIAIGKEALPEGSRFGRTIDDMMLLHKKYPSDWKAARREAGQKYGFGEPPATRTGTNANLNGAMGILALLYGEGDLWLTLDLACALGFDADNQAATMSGLLGIVYGTKGIPRELLFPWREANWTEPFNDRYTNVTREDLPNASLKDIAARMAALGEKVIQKAGGRRVNGYYEIRRDAEFVPPFEIAAGPMPVIEASSAVDYSLQSTCLSKAEWRISGKLPEGLRFEGGRISGTAAGRPGMYAVRVEASCGARTAVQEMKLVVRGQNLAQSADRILAPIERADVSLITKIRLDTPQTFFSASVEVIRDGKRSGDGATFASLGAGSEPRSDEYGYEWSAPATVGTLALTTGFIEETTGWFESLAVQYKDQSGVWRDVERLGCSPRFPDGAVQSLKAHFAEYLMFFHPVQTRAIRIVGPVGGAKNAPRFSSVAELGVYGPIEGTELLN
jgi:hypothetical protein